MNWQRAVEDTVTGLGYDLVDAEKGAGGLLRVFIDHGAAASASQAGEVDQAGEFITVDDCEKVTRQLQHVLEVEGCAYERLEVSSPGLDRPLRKAADYARFQGEQIELTLKVPFQGRKKYRGRLEALGGAWRLLLASDAAPPTRAAKRAAKAAGTVRAGDKTEAGETAKAGEKAKAEEKATAAESREGGDLALDFSLDEVREARLVPVVDFKGRRKSAAPEAALPAGTGSNDEVDGGRIQ